MWWEWGYKREIGEGLDKNGIKVVGSGWGILQIWWDGKQRVILYCEKELVIFCLYWYSRKVWCHRNGDVWIWWIKLKKASKPTFSNLASWLKNNKKGFMAWIKDEVGFRTWKLDYEPIMKPLLFSPK